MKFSRPSTELKKIYFIFGAAAAGLLLFPAIASAALQFPATPCDGELASPQINPNLQLPSPIEQEDGTKAFQYGADNNSFVSQAGSMLSFHVALLFNPHDQNGNPNNLFETVKLNVFDAACHHIAGIGFGNLVPGENIVTYDQNTDVVSLNGQSTGLFANGVPRYFWIEVWDGVLGSQAATYSYLVDLTNPQNPTGTVDGNPEPSGKRPVIIIPGILGSNLIEQGDILWLNLNRLIGSDELDDLYLDSSGNSLHTVQIGSLIAGMNFPSPFQSQNIDVFESLFNELEASGYVNGQTYFLFPYDWRLDLENSAQKLKSEIDSIESQTGFHKIDIIGHSMGGVLAESYISEFGSQDIDKLIFIGTPHLGAPKAAKVLLEGDQFKIPILEPNTMKTLSENSPAAYELTPSQKYFDIYQGYLSKYSIFGHPLLNYSDTRDLLLQKGLNGELLTNAESFALNLENLDYGATDVYNIAGCKTSTQAAYAFDLFGGIGTIGYSSGDGTVPLASAGAVSTPGDHKFYKKSGDHSGLPSQEGVRQLIAGILSGSIGQYEDISNSPSFCSFKGKKLTWRSPVEVHIYDSSGNHTGPIDNNGIEYGVPDIDYEIIGHEKFIYLPTDEGQQYQVIGKGEANGTFDLHITDNDNGTDTESHVFNDVAITSSSTVEFEVSDSSQDDTIELDKLGDNNLQTIPADAVLTPEQTSDLVPPTTTVTLSGIQGNNGWYRSNVQASLNASDDNSGILETRYSLDGVNWQNYSGPISIVQEGTSTISFFSVDRAGNDEPAQSITVKIDKQAPEFAANYNLATKKFKFGSSDNLDLSPNLLCSPTQCTIGDIAGNTTIVKFQISSILQTLRLLSVSYNGPQTTFTSNLLVGLVLQKSGILQSYNQTFYLKDQQILSIQYLAKTNQSTVYTLTSTGTLSKITMPGIKTLQLQTDKGTIKSSIK